MAKFLDSLGLGTLWAKFKTQAQGYVNEHAANGVKHITAEERAAWSAKETPEGAREKADAAERAAKEASRPATWTPTADDIGARPSSWVPTWGQVTDKPTAFPPDGHTHAPADLTSPVPLSKGGTGATTAAAARTALGACAAFGPVLVTVAVSAWAGAGPWTQTVSVAGVTAADNGIGVYPVDIVDGDARKLYEAAYGCLAAEAETVAGGVKLTCRDAKPETSFQVKVQGVR